MLLQSVRGDVGGESEAMELKRCGDGMEDVKENGKRGKKKKREEKRKKKREREREKVRGQIQK